MTELELLAEINVKLEFLISIIFVYSVYIFLKFICKEIFYFFTGI